MLKTVCLKHCIYILSCNHFGNISNKRKRIAISSDMFIGQTLSRRAAPSVKYMECFHGVCLCIGGGGGRLFLVGLVFQCKGECHGILAISVHPVVRS